MTTSEELLLKSGFSQKEVQKLKNNIENHGGSLDSVIHDLSNRFIASRWVSVVSLIVFVLTLIMAAKDTVVTLTITLAIVLSFVWFLAPARLAYKSWRYRKMMAVNSGRHQ